MQRRTWIALPNFDLRVLGQRVSLMDALVARGYSVYALDQRGHGATPCDSSQWLTPSRAADDARVAVAADPVRTDWRGEAEWRALDPAALRVPVLLINGERDPYAARANLPAFMARLSGIDRSGVVLARADHAAHLERQREFVDAVVAFVKTSDAMRPRP